MTLKIGILGAGPAGLTAAVALERIVSPGRIELTLIDRNLSDIDYPGVEYGIQERATKALERLGVKGDALRRGHPVSEIALAYDGGRTIQSVHKVDPSYCFGILRQDFLRDLTSLLHRTEVRRDSLVTRLEPLPDRRVRVHVHAQKPVDYDCVIASDGINSIARTSFFPDARAHDCGFSVIYMLLDGNGRSPANFGVRANGCRVQFTKGKFSTNSFYPQGGDRLTMAFGFDDATHQRLWNEQGLSADTLWTDINVHQKKAITQALAADTPFDDQLPLRAIELVDDWNSYTIYHWKMRDSDALSQPFLTDANIVLLGDSAHAFLPVLGMGASLAIEDAEILSRFFKPVLEDQKAADSTRAGLRAKVFEPFAASRVPVWNDLMLRSRSAARNFISQSTNRRFLIAPYVASPWTRRLIHLAESARGHLGL